MITVTAIWTIRGGCTCNKCQTGRHEYHAAVRDGGSEWPICIKKSAYDELSGQADPNDYRDGGYIAFDRPIEWSDVFAEDRVP